MAYRPIADYALIGNARSAALVGTNGSIDWCCLPHFDSGAVFCRILDAERGGYFQIAPAGKCAVTRRYAGDSAVLETDFETDDGRARLTDFMPAPRLAERRLGKDEPEYHRVLRFVDGLAGRVRLRLQFRPTLDWGRRATRLHLTDGAAWAEDGHSRLRLELRPRADLALRGDLVEAELDIAAGSRVVIDLAHAAAGRPDPVMPDDPAGMLSDTLRHWHEWSAACAYHGPYEEQVRASARVLKLLTFSPTGAMVAAPTSSLPEEIGGVRNWDYRYCWLRDSALVLGALIGLGYRNAALDYFHWLDELCDAECEHLQIMYRLDGMPDMPEELVPHLSGYRGSAPVRIGNAAASQRQLDVYGHVLDAALLALEYLKPVQAGLWHVLRFLAEQAAASWRQPDQGLWETRGPPRQFLSSKLLCWVALDRAVRLTTGTELRGDVAGWRREAEAVRRAILEEGFDASQGAFTQVIGSSELDASALLMPLVGFLPATDPRVRSTVERIRERLTAHGLVYRYLTDDGVPGGENTFAMCSFWLVDNLALQGRVAEARVLFERILSFANDLGLFAEEIDPVGRQLLGNYPQGFTHLALIESALKIARAEGAS